MNNDGSINGKDIQPFVDCLLHDAAAGVDCACADVDWSGVLEIYDAGCFVDLLLTGETDCLIQCAAIEGEVGPRDFGLPPGDPEDCNGNGADDSVDIFNGTSADCNANGIPDECDIADESSEDDDSNGVPDECEPDCNGNGHPDAMDIAAETSVDCNVDGVPDECEFDCNANGVSDDCDIDVADPDGDSEVSADCNANGRPDECDDDCDANSVPDDCDLDPTDPDGDEWVDPDCNGNNYPDACDIDLGPPFGSLDADENGVPDECEESQMMMGEAAAGGSESSEDGTSAGDSSPSPQPSPVEGEGAGFFPDWNALTEAEQEAWSEFYFWCIEQEWGPDSGYSGAEQAARLVEKQQELGLSE